MKRLIICEKPSVSQEYMKTFAPNARRSNGYIESDDYIFTWCVGHLVTMSYPDKYDNALAKWSLAPLPFLPTDYKYEIIKDVKDQYNVVKQQLNRKDVDIIYYAGDSAREGLYIQMLVRMMAGHNKNAVEKVVWLDSQTKEEIIRAVKEAKSVSAYSNLADSGYMRAIEDYAMGINFSRALTLKYGNSLKKQLGLNAKDSMAVAVGRVMTCVLGIIVSREREIRDFQEIPFYRILATVDDKLEAEWKAMPPSAYENTPLLYKANGFRTKEDALCLLNNCQKNASLIVENISKKVEKKFAPLLFNLAELQNECSKKFKISPDQTLAAVQVLYEKKLTTYPRTDARVLSSAVAKEISKVLIGLKVAYPNVSELLDNPNALKLSSKYVDDSKISDHYAIIPTGEGFSAYQGLKQIEKDIFSLIVVRFLSIFYPPAEYYKSEVTFLTGNEPFYASATTLKEAGFMKITGYEIKEEDQKKADILATMQKGSTYPSTFEIREGKTSPPKRYDSGSIILTMENAGQFIEEESLREQIKSCGIGTSATRAEIIKKLIRNEYIALNTKTQILTPSRRGEMIYEVVSLTIPSLLSPNLTASWEKGLEGVASGSVSKEEYRKKLENYIQKVTNAVKDSNAENELAKRCEKL